MTELQKVAKMAAEEAINRVASQAWIDRQRALRDEAFKNTEKLLYCYNALKDHIADEEEYIEMAFKGKSTSFVSYSKNKAAAPDESEKVRSRVESYERSKADKERIEKALDRVKDRRGYEVIVLRYLQRKDYAADEPYTFEEIAEMLAGTKDYSVNLNEKTVRRYKNSIISEMSVLLFGSDAI